MTAEMQPGFQSPPRPTFFERIRSTLRSTQYRAECRQAGLARPIALAAVGTLGLALPAPVTLYLRSYIPPDFMAATPLILWLVVLSMPGTLIGGSVRRDRDSGLMEAMLLTPSNRADSLWAKILTHLRPVLWAALACPFAGALIGAFLERSLSAALWCFVGGGVVGVFSLGEALLISAIDLRSGLRCRGWLTAALLSGATWIGIHACEALALLVIFGMVATLYAWSRTLALALAAVAVLVRTLIVNVLLPEMLVAHCAVQFDRLALRQISPKEH